MYVPNFELVENALRCALKRGESERGVLIFFDLLCGFCKKLIRNYGDKILSWGLELALADFLVLSKLEPHSVLRCREDWYELIKRVINYDERIRGVCVTDAIARCEAAGIALGITGVPTVIFYDKAKRVAYMHRGYTDIESELRKLKWI